MRSFYEANLALADKKPDFDLYDESAPIYTNVRMLPPAKFQDADAHRLDDRRGVRRDARDRRPVASSVSAPTSATAPRCAAPSCSAPTICRGARLARGAASTPPITPASARGTVIEGAIIDKNVQVGRNCRITNADGLEEATGDGWTIRDGVIVLHKNAVIPDDTVI